MKQMGAKPWVLAVWLTASVLHGSAFAADTTGILWKSEMEGAVRPSHDNKAKAAEVVEDAAASGGKAVRIPFTGRGTWIFQAPDVELQGKCFLTLYVRGEGMLPLTHGVNLNVIAQNRKAGRWAYNAPSNIYGVNLKPQGYTAVTLTLPVSPMAAAYPVEILIRAPEAPKGVPMAMLLDRAEIRSQVLDAPVIADLRVAKIHYRPTETVSATVTLVNPAGKDFAGTLAGREHLGLTGKRDAFSQPVQIKSGATRKVTVAWKLGPEEYGREIVVELRRNDKAVATASKRFSVSKTPRYLSVRGGACERFELWDWAPGDLAELTPTESVFCSGQGAMFYRSKEGMKQRIADLVKRGYWPESYVNGTAYGIAGYRLFARRPEWFLFSGRGEVSGYNMRARESFRGRHFVDYDRKKGRAAYLFQGVLNHSLPEVQEFIANQLITCAKVMGIKGVRFDVRHLGVHVGERDFRGREIVKTQEEADRMSAGIIRRVKAMVRKECPTFTFGYNYCAPEENKDWPLTWKERCADGGWMLDELAMVYRRPSSPYCIWSAYARRMTSWGDSVSKLGGIYSPYNFDRGTNVKVADNIYGSIFRLIGGGRTYYQPPYANSRLPHGDLAWFATRYSECLFGRQRDWLPKINGEVDVRAKMPVWWKDMVFWNRDSRGRRQLIVHLVNPPFAPEIDANPLSKINPPVRDVEVLCAPVKGKPPVRACLLMCEPMEFAATAEIKAMELPMEAAANGRVSVTVPGVLFWKIVVFEFAG